MGNIQVHSEESIEKVRESVKEETNIEQKVDNLFEKTKSIGLVDNKIKKNNIPLLVKLPYKKFLTVLLSALMIFVTIASASLINAPLESIIDFVSISINPRNVSIGEKIFVNITVAGNYTISSVLANISTDVLINLSLQNNSSYDQLWCGGWIVKDAEIGEHIIDIILIDDNTSYHLEDRFYVVNKTVPVIIQSLDIGLNETDRIIVNNTITAGNETISKSELNISLLSEKNQYYLNETVLVYGNVTYNNSLINSSVNLLLNNSNNNLSLRINASGGKYQYQFIPPVVGKYVIHSEVSYKNITDFDEIEIYIFEILSENISMRNDSELIIWDDTSLMRKYIGENITFYTNYSSGNLIINNATCLISYRIENWTKIHIMNYSDGLYFHTKSFNNSGNFEYRVWCSSTGFENQTSSKEFSIFKINDSLSIVDRRREQVYLIPGTRFYVERTIEGYNGLNVIFAPLYSDCLTFEKIELFEKIDSKGEEKLVKITNNKSLKSSYFKSGKGKSNVERRIDTLRENLPDDIQILDRIAYSQSIKLQNPVTVRMWFKVPSWEEIHSGSKSSSGRISYLVFSNDTDDYDFEGSTWWNSNWNYRKLVTINSSYVESDLTNFPVLFYESSDSDLSSSAQSNGEDIAFVLWSDNTTKLNHELELYNSGTGELAAWVNVTYLRSTENTKIWMYYNNSACSSQENPTGVWDSNYVLIQHLQETSTGTRYDSTSYENNGTTSGYDGDEAVTGKIDGADDFDGNDDKISISDSSSLDPPNNMTIEAWVKFNELSSIKGSPQHIIFKRHSIAPLYNYELLMNISDNIYFRWVNSTQINKTTGYSGNIQADEWYYLVGKKDGNSLLFYLNGSTQSTWTNTTSGMMFNSDSELNFSCNASQNYLNGTIDEVRISNIARSTSWINTTYYNLNNPTTFATFDSQEIDTSIEITPSVWNQGSVEIGSSNATTGYYFNLTNVGDVTINVQIKASNATNSSTGARWNLNSTPGHNNFSLQNNKSGGGSWININSTYDTFVTNLGASSWQTFDLNLIMATTSSTIDPLSLTITFKTVVS